MTIVVGLDPSSGVSSPVGVAIFDPATREILHTEEVWPKRKRPEHRLREINAQIQEILSGIDPAMTVKVYIESTVMMGKSNQIFQQAVGAIKAAVPFEFELTEVHNTTVKKLAAGSGKADKKQLAVAMSKWFNSESVLDYGFDITDALAIGVSGWERDAKG